jgi:hypothetical protein
MTFHRLVHTRLAALGAVFCLTGCGAREPRTDAERAAAGRDVVLRMSTKLGSAPVFSVRTTETRDQVKGSGIEQVRLTREMIVRRPDRFYFKTAGGVDTEGWYDGVGVTLVMHKEKVFGQARMPETLDRTLDAIHERYGISIPVGDLLYSSPAKALLTDSTTGGWVARETTGGASMHHVKFSDRGVEWDLWVPISGDPLPARFVATFPNDKRLRHVDITFSDWNFAPAIAGDRFDPKVPSDYEGVAMLQRASVLEHMKDAPVPTVGTDKK